ncbi:phosrestin-2 [Ixodes scapularis]
MLLSAVGSMEQLSRMTMLLLSYKRAAQISLRLNLRYRVNQIYCVYQPSSLPQYFHRYLDDGQATGSSVSQHIAAEGVVVLDRSQLQPSERLYVALVGRFRYGREEDEILGMSLCREIYLGHTQLCPDALEVPGDAPGPSRSPGRPLYSMQLGNVHRRLLEALGDAAVPFRFEFPRDAPVSTVMQRLTPGSGDTCGVRYLIRCYTVLEEDDRPPARSCVNMPIRKAQFACTPRSLPSSPRASSVCKDFPLNAGKLVVDASLPKELYLHGEEIVVKVVIQNLSQKTVKHVKASVLQVADICMFSTGRWKVCVATANNSKDDSPIAPGTTVEREISILPSLEDNQHKYGVFVQSYRGDDVDCLASSTITVILLPATILAVAQRLELYLHGEEIVVKVVIQNLSQKTVKHVKASVLQVADICMFSTGRWKVCVATANNSKDDSPIAPGTTVEREISILPSLEDNQHKYGVFVQSYRGDDVDCLASSTIISDHAKKNLFGIVVSYEVKVKIGLGTLSSLSGRGEIACFVPFLLMHAGPAEVPKPDSFEENEILTVHRPMTPPPSTSGIPLPNGLEAAIAESANAGTAIVGPYESSPPASIDFLDESPTEGSPVALSQDLPEPEVIQKLSDINIRGVPPLID